MATISTLEQMRDYIKMMCGHPVIVVEVDDSQLDQIIDDSIQFFQKFNSSEGNFLEYLVLTTEAGVSEYSLSGYEGAFDIELSIGLDGINTLFSPTNMLLYSDFVKKGSTIGGQDSSPGLTITSWDIAFKYLEEIKNKFGKMYTVRYNPNRGTLHITPTPTDAVTGVVYMYKRESSQYLYNHILVKKLALGKTKELWGFMLGKNILTMPDGITINGNDIKTDGQNLAKEAEEEIRGQDAPIDFFLA